MRMNEWDEIKEIADYAVDCIGNFDYNNSAKIN